MKEEWEVEKWDMTYKKNGRVEGGGGEGEVSGLLTIANSLQFSSYGSILNFRPRNKPVKTLH